MSRAAAVSIGLASMALAAACSRAEELKGAEPSAAEIVAKNVAARGGLDAWRKVETMVWVGHIESVHAPMPSMAFELEQKRPNKTRLQIDVLGERSMRLFDGVRGWKLRQGRGRPDAQPYTPQELRFAQAGHVIDGPLVDHAAKGDPVALASLDELGKRKAYHLKVHLAKGGDEEVWVDAETYLELRYDRMADAPGGAPRRVSTVYDDYRTVDGLKIPFLVETGGGPGGASPDKMRIERVVLNAPLDDTRFGSGLAPRGRGRGLPGVEARSPAPGAPSAAAGVARGAGPE